MHAMARLIALLSFVPCAPAVLAGPCLTNPNSQVGNSVFNATVQTFIGLGVNPNVTCIENGKWTDPSNFGLGSYVKGGDGFGATGSPNSIGTFNNNGTQVGNANGRDFYWVQDNGNQVQYANQIVGGRASQGVIWDLGGQANQVVVFPFVDHDPVPGEALESTVWLSNDPNAADSGWTQAFLDHVYGAGWSADPDVADGFVGVYRLANSATFRYVSVTWGGPGSLRQDGDNEIDAVGGLDADGNGVGSVPSPSTTALLLLALAALRRTRQARGVQPAG